MCVLNHVSASLLPGHTNQTSDCPTLTPDTEGAPLISEGAQELIVRLCTVYLVIITPYGYSPHKQFCTLPVTAAFSKLNQMKPC